MGKMFTLLATPVIVDITVFAGFLIVTVAAPYPYNQSTLVALYIDTGNFGDMRKTEGIV